MKFLFFFFFQAEDGIRDGHVTGVQTCALPILRGDVMGARCGGERRLVECLVVPSGVDRRFAGEHHERDAAARGDEIGRASCRERVWMWVGAGVVKEEKQGWEVVVV